MANAERGLVRGNIQSGSGEVELALMVHNGRLEKEEVIVREIGPDRTR